MLGKERSMLINRSFDLSVSDDTRYLLILFIENIFNGSHIETCELTLVPGDTPPLEVQLTGTITSNGEHCFITAVDITRRKRAELKCLRCRNRYFTQRLESITLLGNCP